MIDPRPAPIPSATVATIAPMAGISTAATGRRRLLALPGYVDGMPTSVSRRHTALLGSVLFLSAGVASACGGGEDGEAGAATAERTVEVDANEYAFFGDPGTIVAGDTIEFVVSNTGVLDHSMQVLTGEGRVLGQTDRILPGDSDTVVVTFADAGPYRLICDIDDHLSRGQSAGLTVVDG